MIRYSVSRHVKGICLPMCFSFGDHVSSTERASSYLGEMDGKSRVVPVPASGSSIQRRPHPTPPGPHRVST